MIDQHVKTFTARLQSYPDWPELEDLPQCAACVVPMKDRPLDRDVEFDVRAAVRSAGPPQASTTPSGGSDAHSVASVGAS